MNGVPVWVAVVAVLAIILAAVEYSPKVGGLLLVLVVFTLLAIGLRKGTIRSVA